MLRIAGSQRRSLLLLCSFHNYCRYFIIIIIIIVVVVVVVVVVAVVVIIAIIIGGFFFVFFLHPLFVNVYLARHQCHLFFPLFFQFSLFSDGWMPKSCPNKPYIYNYLGQNYHFPHDFWGGEHVIWHCAY